VYAGTLQPTKKEKKKKRKRILNSLADKKGK